MNDEERRAKDAQRKREAYRRRKEAQAELSNKSPTPEAEEAWRMVHTDGKPISAEEIVHYVDSKEKADAILADSTAREEYVELLFSPYAKVTNIPQLLQAILREQITLRVTLTDLIGGLRK